ncbi:Bug family tripartite tricarboxylate transporter substrate binding protein [Falsiroseomonas tokyonensis]|uniref:Bug family tripartite tricarboxylate transporter substrate binding protein n=1 Tax=Falsiroseomonas tokyonensis TaxID=430521 RepID=A0ABV7BPG8_9PROT|nr:tripartite tricarboxylate transporter substrate binding protein [Falsiroseomonas tokyonensis]MBU8536459.1 tripartite tricarboxylate transporter substrate binding protein [Falsiroseomonas tokyonensis]
MPQRRTLLATALAALAAPRLARAQAWPSRPVRIVEPGAPGGGNDTTIRLFAPHLERAFGQSFVVDNRPGAGGRVGVENAFRAPPDGSTLLVGNAGSNGINAAIYPDLPYDLEKDFTPISLLVTGPNALVVNPRVFPVDNVAGLIAAIKEKPQNHYNYGSGGVGSSAHLSAELFCMMAGVRMEHIPYRGAAQMGQAVITGDAPFLIANMVNIMPFVTRGEVKLLAVTSLERWPDTPQVPTLDESGLAGFETIAWNALFGPPGLPSAVVERLVPELQRIGQLPEVKDRVKLIGGQVVTSTPDVLAARVRSDIAKWKDLATRANIRVT